MKTPVLRARSCFTSLNLLASAIAIASLVGAPAARAGTDLWIGNPGVDADTNWSDTANWSLGVNPSGNDAVFNNTGAVGAAGQVDNVVDQSGLNPSSLSYTNGTGFFHTTLIPAGITVTATNGLNVGFNAAAAFNTSVAITGPGELDVDGTVQVGLDKFSSTTLLDMSGLGTFNQNAPTNQFLMSFTSVNNPTVNLATNSTINVATLAVEDSNGQNGRTGVLNLGSGTNIIEASTIHVGLSKGTGTIQFPAAAPATAGVSITGTGGGTARASILLGQSSSGSGSSAGSLLLAGHPANVLASTVTIANRGNDTGNATGTVTLDNGTLDATTILLAEYSANATAKTSTGTLTIGGNPPSTATLIVNSPSGPGGGSFVLSDNIFTSGNSFGTFNLNANGTALVYTSITRSGSSTGTNTATLNINGGTLNMEGATNSIGTPTIPINNVNLNGGTLQLYVVGGASTPVINASNLTASAVNTLDISVANVTGSASIPLMSYIGPDPGTNTFVINVPTNFVATLDDNGSSLISLSLVPAGVTVFPLLWVGAVGSTVNSNWNYTTANWDNLTNPAPQTYTNPDLVTFDDSASNSTVNLTANFTPGSLTFSNGITPNPLTGSPLAYTLTGAGSIGGAFTLIDANSGSVTLRETGGDSFTGGISVGNGGTVLLDDPNSSISGGVSIGTGATLQIGNNDASVNPPSGSYSDTGSLTFDKTDNATISNTISGSGVVNQIGTGVLTLAADNSGLTGNIGVTAGTLALTGAGSIANAANVSIGAATLDLSGVPSGITTLQNLSLSSSVLTLGTTNQQAPLTVSSLTMGNPSTINVSALPPIASYPSAVTLVQSQSAISLNAMLGTLPAGFTGSLSNNTAINAIQVVLTSGPIGQRPYLIWSGADLATSINWSDAQDWQLPGAPLSADNVIFNDTDAQSGSAYNSPGGGAANLNLANINNNVNANFSVSTLNYTNLAAMYQNTYITDGMTLTVTNSMAIGSSSTDFGSSASEFVSFAGTNGTLTVDNTNSAFFVGLVFAGAGSEQATLDMSGLGTFNASVSSFAVGAVASTAVGTIGTAYLAQTNNITAIGGTPNEGGQDEPLSFMVGQTGKNGAGVCSLYLGQQNTIFANSVGVSLAKEVAQMSFNTTFVNPTATFFGAGGVGTPVSVWSIGDGLAQTGGSTRPSGTVDFTAGTVNALVTTMYIGRTPNASGGNACTGMLTFGAGTIAIQTVYNGYQAFSNTDSGVGTINVNGPGILQVGKLNMAQTTGGTGAASTTGTLNIIGGSAEIGTIVGSEVGQGTSTVTLQNGGTLAISNTAGTLAAPLTTLNLGPLGGTLQLSPINGGTNIVATTVTTSGTTTINIASVVNASGTMQIPLIYYGASADPFASLTLGTTPVGFTSPSLVDDTAHQSVDLLITAPPAAPSTNASITHVSLSGTNLLVHGTNNNVPNTNFHYAVLTSTNVATPLSNWTILGTNSFNPDGTFDYTNPIVPGTPRQFIDVKAVP